MWYCFNVSECYEKPGWAEHWAWRPGPGLLLRRVGTGSNKSHISSLKISQKLKVDSAECKSKIKHVFCIFEFWVGWQWQLNIHGPWLLLWCVDELLMVLLESSANSLLTSCTFSQCIAGRYIHVRRTPLRPSPGQVWSSYWLIFLSECFEAAVVGFYTNSVKDAFDQPAWYGPPIELAV